MNLFKKSKGNKSQKQSQMVEEEKDDLVPEDSLIKIGITGVQEKFFINHKREEIPFMIEDNPLNIIKLRKQDQIPYWDEVIKRNPLSYAIAPQEVRRNVDNAIIAVRENPLLFKDAPAGIKRNVEFQKEVIKSGADNIFKEHIENLKYQDNTPEASIDFLAEVFKLQMESSQESEKVNERRVEQKSNFVKPPVVPTKKLQNNREDIQKASKERLSPEMPNRVKPRRTPVKLSTMMDVIKLEDELTSDRGRK